MSFLRRSAIRLYELVNGRHILERMAELDRVQWLSREDVIDYQQKKLYRMLKYAYTYVPYYRHAFEQAGFQPEDILTDPSSFRKVPTISKAIINDNFDDLVTTDPNHQKGLARNSTGGSTGQPLIFIQDLNFRDYVMAGVHSHMQYMDWKFGECHAYIWGADYEVATQKTMRARLLHWSLNRFVTNAFTLSGESMLAFVEKIRQRHPKVLVGYTSALVRFANFVREHHLDDIKFSGITSTAEVLYPDQRELIESTFGCEVFNRYATRELGGIACECAEHRGLHIGAGEVYVEILRDGEPVPVGEEGDVVVTNLNNYGMPFIRYHVGDIGQLSDEVCPCGRGLPMMDVVRGRTSDMFKTREGRLVHGEFFTHLFYGVSEVKQFQVVQKSYDRIVVSIVEKSPVPKERLAFLERAMKDIMQSGVEIEFEFVESIPLQASGKYRFTISEVG